MFSPRRTLAVIIAITSFVSAMATVYAAAPDARLQKQAREPGGSETEPVSLGRIPYLLRALFPVPISYEGHPSYYYTSKEEPPFTVVYHVSRNESLANCLDRFVAASRGLLTWTTIRGNIVILPKKQREDEMLTAMDTKVSLELKSASPWEAFKALEKAVNSAAGGVRRVHISPHTLFDARKPLAEFTNTHTITLKLENVSAREAACAIMTASPIPLSYSYGVSRIAAQDTLLVFMYKGGHVGDAGRMTGEEARAWELDKERNRNK